MNFLQNFFTLNFTSLYFFAALSAIVLLYYVAPKKLRWLVLLFSNAAFVFAAGGAKCLFVMAAMFFVAWVSSHLFEVFCERPAIKKQVLVFAIFFNAGLLVLMKDAIFFANLFRVSKDALRVPLLQSLAPAGMSYWTLTLISYLLDCYWNSAKAEKNFLKFAAFAGFFPLLVSGPIIRNSDAKKILGENDFRYENLCFGAQRILWGVFKKLVIAERLSIFVNAVYSNFEAYAGLYLWTAFLFFAIQLYADFSGCVDIVLGAAKLFGISLPENFSLPFLAKNLSEFWRKWHITLGAFLRDYILYPLFGFFQRKIGRSCKKIFPKAIAKNVPIWAALFVSWFLIGFWHGGYWNFIIGSGLYYWTLIVLGELCKPLFKKLVSFLKINTENFSWQFFLRARTFFFFVMGASLFRFRGGFLQSRKMYKAAFSLWNPWIFFDGSIFRLGLDAKEFNVLFFAMAILLLSAFAKAKAGTSLREEVAKQGVIFRWAAWLLLLLFTVIFGNYGPGYNPADFIYGGF